MEEELGTHVGICIYIGGYLEEELGTHVGICTQRDIWRRS